MIDTMADPPDAAERGYRNVRIRFPLDLWADLHTLAERDERSLNGEVVYLLRRVVRAELERQP